MYRSMDFDDFFQSFKRITNNELLQYFIIFAFTIGIDSIPKVRI